MDADACPRVIRDILVRAAQRVEAPLNFVANHALGIPQSPWVRCIQVEKGFDVADNEIVKRLGAGDLVITGDIPLAAEVVAKQGLALNPRGELYTVENIKERLAMRDLMESLRSSGIETGGQAPLNHGDRKAFADQLDRIISRHQQLPGR